MDGQNDSGNPRLLKASLTTEWQGEDAFIIGGGASLKTFDFPWLQGRRVLGVNDAFRIGPVCSRIIFADDGFWKTNKWELEAYANTGGMVYSLAPTTEQVNLPWLHQLKRGGSGLSRGPEVIGWNHNTGASALNVALIMGARRVFLLGFDMTDIRGATHWHNRRPGPTPVASFVRFLSMFIPVSAQLNKFPGQTVFNVTDGISKLEGFPKITVAEMKQLVVQKAMLVEESA